MKRSLTLVIGCVLVVGMVGAALAQFARSEDAIKYRQSVMFLIGQHFGRIGAVVQGKVPFEQQAVAQNADLVATLARLPWEAFMIAGTDSGSALKSTAFTDQDGFKAAAEDAGAEIAKLAEAAAAGDPDAIRAQFGTVAQSCRACHGKYRR
jgi:cytochrome c556